MGQNIWILDAKPVSFGLQTFGTGKTYILVWLSKRLKTKRLGLDFGYTVDVRKPDVRFGELDVFMSGFQTSGFRTSEDHSLYPVFRHSLYLKCLKTGRYIRFSDIHCISNV